MAVADPPMFPHDEAIAALARFVARYPRLFVLTGAGCSTDSGIPDYRDADGAWKHRPPTYYREFVGHESARRRYWARSLTGWERLARARANAAHHALARLETAGFVRALVTQNVDGLHQQAGSRAVIDLHGRLDAVECLDCGERTARSDLQERLRALNPGRARVATAAGPDGDALLEETFDDFRVPACESCGGTLKPAVVFFGECVPAERVAEAHRALTGCDALLVVGSSLMVYSGYRFCRAARERGMPLAAVNLGRTRADDELTLKTSASCTEILPALAARLAP